MTGSIGRGEAVTPSPKHYMWLQGFSSASVASLPFLPVVSYKVDLNQHVATALWSETAIESDCAMRKNIGVCVLRLWWSEEGT